MTRSRVTEWRQLEEKDRDRLSQSGTQNQDGTMTANKRQTERAPDRKRDDRGKERAIETERE
jgi:hypothetical protein